MLFYLFNKVFNGYGSIIYIIIFTIYAISLLFLPNILSMFPLPYGRLPLKLDTALLAVVFIGLAAWNREYVFRIIKKHKSVKSCICVVLVAAIASYANGWTNMNSLDFGRVRLLYYPIAIMGIISVCLVSSYVCSNSYPKLSNILSFYGKNSLIIFVFQSLYIRLYLLTFNKFFDLDMTLYGRNPFCHQLGSFLLVSFILSPITVLLFLELKKRGLKIF